jgi:ABC-type spermidine/putrescine transport system permease subunit II
MITFACCFGELSASQIVRPAGMDTVPRKMLGDLHAGVNELTAGITIVTVLVIVGISATGWWVVNLSHKLSERKYS